MIAQDEDFGPMSLSVQQEPRRGVDIKRIEAAVRSILVAIGDDPDRPGLVDTPSRVARAYAEMFAGMNVEPLASLGAVFNEYYEDIVLVSDISVTSVCEHHLLPFVGTAQIGYVPGPDGAVVGLSKLARLVDTLARRPQVQERLTTQIADALVSKLGARGVIVVIDCTHSCMSTRGVRESAARTRTSVARGVIRTDERYRSEALALVQGGSSQ